MSQVKAIYARAANAVMGNKNMLPWSVPADIKRFKALTTGCIVVMGYNTFASLGYRPLPNRQNIVLCDPTRPLPNAAPGNVKFFESLEHVMLAHRLVATTVWVIGGPALIAQAMDDYDAEVHRTTLAIEPSQGDVYSHKPDRQLSEYARVGYEEFNCYASGIGVVFERFVKAGINAGLK